MRTPISAELLGGQPTLVGGLIIGQTLSAWIQEAHQTIYSTTAYAPAWNFSRPLFNCSCVELPPPHDGETRESGRFWTNCDANTLRVQYCHRSDTDLVELQRLTDHSLWSEDNSIRLAGCPAGEVRADQVLLGWMDDKTRRETAVALKWWFTIHCVCTRHSERQRNTLLFVVDKRSVHSWFAPSPQRTDLTIDFLLPSWWCLCECMVCVRVPAKRRVAGWRVSVFRSRRRGLGWFVGRWEDRVRVVNGRQNWQMLYTLALVQCTCGLWEWLCIWVCVIRVGLHHSQNIYCMQSCQPAIIFFRFACTLRYSMVSAFNVDSDNSEKILRQK